MRRILLDENTPHGIREQLQGDDVRTTSDMGWSGLTNGNLLDVAEAADIEIMITGDKNLVNQQHLSGRKQSVIELSTTHWPTIRQHPGLLSNAISGVGTGAYIRVTFPRPPLRRRIAKNPQP